MGCYHLGRLLFHRHRFWMTMMLAMISALGSVSAMTPLVHMTNHCYQPLPVNTSLLLDLTDALKADRVMVGHLACAVTLRAPSANARLFAHVLQLAISDHAQMPDRLHIYDVTSSGEVSDRLTPSTGLYGVMERPVLVHNTAGMVVPDFRSSGPRMRLDYQGKPTIVFRGFRVLITVVYPPEVNGGCPHDTVRCSYASMCVPGSVRCDDFPNCGINDNSDEKSCRREYVVSNVTDEHSTRTAVIAAVVGIVVFLGVAALVLVFLVKYTRRKYGRDDQGTDQSALFSARGGGGANTESDRDLDRLYAPPSYEDVMTPRGHEDPALFGAGVGVGVGARYKHRHHRHHRHQHHHRHFGPPPAYSDLNSADYVNAKSPSTPMSSDTDDTADDHTPSSTPTATPFLSTNQKRPANLAWSASQQEQQQRHKHTQHNGVSLGNGDDCDGGGDDGDDDVSDGVRMHGTWPSDTDEEEEVRIRRKKKGGRCKGVKQSRDQASGEKAGDGDDGAATTITAPENINGETSLSPTLSHSTSPPPHSHLPLKSALPSSRQSPGERRGGGEGGGGSSEVVSETESQLGAGAGSKRNSRTESNSPDTCTSSSAPSSARPSPGASPPGQSSAKPQADGLDLHRPLASGPESSYCAPPSPSIHPMSPSVLQAVDS